MADSKSKSGAPNFYSALAESAGGGGGAPGTGAGAGAGMSPGQSKPGTADGKKGEKVQNIATLLEVFKKMDAMEDDPANKDLLQQMLNLGMQYKTRIEGGGGAGAGAGAGAEAGASAGTPPGGGAGGGSAAGGMGAGPGGGAPPPMGGGSQVP